MAEHYWIIKQLHIYCVLASGGLFALRGLLMAFERRELSSLPVLRHASYAIDTVLLTAAVFLLIALHLNPLTQPWLALKLMLLLGYIVLGSYALKRGRTRGHRILYFIAAVGVYLIMFGVARAHHPLGWLLLWGG